MFFFPVVIAFAALSAGTAGAAGATNGPIVHTNHFAGYEASVAATQVASAFVVPTISCTDTYSGIVPFAALNNFTTNEFSAAGVSAQCLKGTPTYQAYTEINDAIEYSSQVVNPGDTIDVSVQASSTSTTAKVTDVTNGSASTSTQSGPGGGGTFTSASVGAGGVGTPKNPSPPFGSIAFSGSKVNGEGLNVAGPAYRYEWFTKKVLIVATSLLTSNGTAFTTSQP
jgi:hypothetical protein